MAVESSRAAAAWPEIKQVVDHRPPHYPTAASHSLEWLFWDMDEIHGQAAMAEKLTMPRVPEKLREHRKLTSHFEPSMVSLGPYHHGKPHLHWIEPYKRMAARHFTGSISDRRNAYPFYEAVRQVSEEAIKCYGGYVRGLSQESFTQMMFLDGCFLLHFMLNVLEYERWDGELWSNVQPLSAVLRDIMLLENQIPFLVLDQLMAQKNALVERNIVQAMAAGEAATTVMPMNTRARNLPHIVRLFVLGLLKVPRHTVELFVKEAMQGVGRQQTVPQMEEDEPFHILDQLRMKLLGTNKRGGSDSIHGYQSYADIAYTFRSATELKAAGIGFYRSQTNSLMDVRFEKKLIAGKLFLPRIVVDDNTQPMFFNLIAYELSNRGRTDYGVVSYMGFMASLMNCDKDVEVLVSEGVLTNSLGSSSKVVELFKVLDMDVSNPGVYSSVKRNIEEFCNIRWRALVGRSIYSLSNNYFHSPWAAISFVTALYILSISSVQTYFTVYPSYK